MDNYQTPVRKKKPRILGMTLPQLGLLAGLLVIQLVILVLALKFIVFAPKKEQQVEIPTLISVATLASASETMAPTPIPDFTTAVLTIDDLPAGFVPAQVNEADNTFNFNVLYPKIDFHPASSFAWYELQKKQYVVGWTFMFTTTEAREKFDVFVSHPLDMFYSSKNPDVKIESLAGAELGGSSPIGELSTGWTAPMDAFDLNDSDVVLFSHKNFGGIVEVFYNSGEPQVIGAWELAKELDHRIMDVLVNGPIPTPVVINYDALAATRLSLDDLPPNFRAIPDSELAIDEKSRSGMTEIGMRVASVFGFKNETRNAEETILGYTFQFTSTIGKAVMDQMLASDDLLNAMFAPTPTQKRQVLEVTKPIGDRALSTAIMDMTATGGIHCDVLVFRRGHVGAALFYIYVTGRRQTTVEDLAVKLDAKIQALASP